MSIALQFFLLSKEFNGMPYNGWLDGKVGDGFDVLTCG